MENEEALRKLGLNKYEAKAYLCIFRYSVVDAKTICEEEKIPYGKIYETLSSLEDKKFIEVQNTRPKKYHAIKPSIAFESFFEDKKSKMELELDNVKELLDTVGENITHKNKVKSKQSEFWKVAFMKDVPKMLIECFENTEHEINLLIREPEDLQDFSELSDELFQLIGKFSAASKRGIKLKILRNKNKRSHLLKYIEKPQKDIVRMIKETDEEISNMFMIFDKETVLMSITNPLKKNSVLAMIKIWNPALAKELNSSFLKLWKKEKFIVD